MKVIVIGGVAGGASAAARLRRLDEKAEILMFEKGEHISYASCGLPYYLSDEISEREKLLVMTPELFKGLLNVEVRTNSEVVEINHNEKTVTVKNLLNEQTYTESYDKLILSPGAKPFIPPIEGIESEKVYTVRNVNDADKIKNSIKQNNHKTAVVVGGGFIGVEVAENLKEAGLEVSLVEMNNQLCAQIDPEIAAQIHNHIQEKGVNLYLNNAVSKFLDENSKIKSVLNDNNFIESDFVVFAIGVTPESDLAKKARIETGPRGHIIVDENLRTNLPDIYSLGDAIEVVDFVSKNKTAIPLAGPANRQGRIVAQNVSGFNSQYKGTLGTSILKVFDLSVASTGQNEKQLKKNNVEYLKTYIHGFSHASYYPGAFPLLIKLLFNKKGKILGSQITGYEGVDKRIDVIATAIKYGGTINDLIDLELSYAPPFNSAKDPVNLAGMSAQNILNGLIRPLYWDDIDSVVEKASKKELFLLDVRTNEEALIGTLPESTQIPLEELRERLNEIPKDKRIVIYCTKGLKSYFGARILQQRGFENVYTINGGYSIYKQLKRTAKKQTQKEAVVAMGSTKEFNLENTKTIKIDASGLSCPGPIMKLSKTIQEIEPGEAVEISTTDPGFKPDVKAWCESTGNQLLEIKEENKTIKAIISKGNTSLKQSNNINEIQKNKNTFVVFSNDLDKVMASFIIANGAKAQGKEVTMFFTFWGLNVLRRENISIKKGIVDTMFGWMMPKGANKLSLSKMNMGGLGTQMMKAVMKQKNVFSLPELIEQAQQNNIKLVACQMAMDVMGIKKEELIDNVEIGGVAYYLNEADQATSNLFI